MRFLSLGVDDLRKRVTRFSQGRTGSLGVHPANLFQTMLPMRVAR